MSGLSLSLFAFAFFGENGAGKKWWLEVVYK